MRLSSKLQQQPAATTADQTSTDPQQFTSISFNGAGEEEGEKSRVDLIV